MAINLSRHLISATTTKDSSVYEKYKAKGFSDDEIKELGITPPAKPKSMADIYKQNMKRGGEFYQGAITGAVRGIGNIAGFAASKAGTIPDLGTRLTGKGTPVSDFMKPLGQKISSGAERLATGFESINERNIGLNPKSIPSKVGQFAGQVALTAPIGGIGTAGKIGAGIKGALEAGTYAAASTGKVSPLDLAAGGALGTLGKGVSNIVKKAPDTLKKQAEKSVMQALGPTKEKFKQKASKLAPEFIKKGLIGSREGLQQKAVAGMEDIGSQIDDMFGSGSIKGKVKTAPIIKSLESLKTKVGKVDIDPARTKVINGVKDVIKQFGDDLSPSKARAVRQALDKIVYSTKGVIGDEALSVKNLARKEAADEIRKQFSAISPDLAKLNKEFSFWSNLDEVLTETAKRTGPQSGGLISKIAGSGALGGTLATGGGAMPAAAAAVLTTKFVSAMQSPLWKTVSAKSKSKLADAIVNGSKTGIISAVNEIQKRIPKIPFAIEIKNKLGLNE